MPHATRRTRVRAHLRRPNAAGGAPSRVRVSGHVRNLAQGFHSTLTKARFGVTSAHNPTTQQGTPVYIRDGRKELTDLDRARALAVRLSSEMPRVEFWVVPASAAFGWPITRDNVYHRYLGGRCLADPDGGTPRVDPGSL